MGSNGFVTETAHLNVDKKKFGEGYDRIFKAECVICGEVGSKSQMIKNDNDTYTHKTCGENLDD